MKWAAHVAIVGALFATVPQAAASAAPYPMYSQARTQEAKPCKDRVVKWIRLAGFDGPDVRVAWAIAQRESNGTPSESTYPDLGLMQLNAPTWMGTKYWPRDVYDPVQNLKAVKRMVRDKGWQPWGLRVSKSGQISYDFSSYAMWSDWQKTHWIVIPFEKYFKKFPKECR